MNHANLGRALFVASLFAAGPLSAQDSLRAPIRRRTVAEDLQLFSQVLNQIRVNHPDSVDTHSLLMAAIEGMVAAADPHSYVIPAARLDSTREAAFRDGRLTPIPISFGFMDGAAIVSSVAPGSRAVTLDILPGDELVAADGRPIAASSSDELDLALAGNKGSSAVLGFRRRRADGSLVRFERTVARERVAPETAVPVSIMVDSSTGYVRITTFMGDRVADDLHAALEQLEGSGMRRLVLDLRGNGGGSVAEAKRIAAEFLPRNAIIYTASGRKSEVTDTARVERFRWSSERRYPIVVLVDNGTASASELVAGALQDHDRALIVGRTTFGKSLLMQTFPLTDGSRMALVIGRVQTPCGRVVQRDYHGESRRAYYREAGERAESAQRSPCKTDNGRTVYGGGGIVPDIQLAETSLPPWLSALNERGLLFTWAAAFAAKPGATPITIETLAKTRALDAAAIADFRSYATSNGAVVPSDAGVDETLSRGLVRYLAFTRFGTAGFYRLTALTDPAVRSAIDAFAKTEELLRPQR